MQSTPQKLGLWTSASLVMGNMIGAGVFLMPATIASYGSIGIIGWFFAAIGAFLVAKVFANLSKMMPISDGGPYAYSQKGLGNFAGFLVAWSYWVSVWVTNAAITISFVSAMSTFFPLLVTHTFASVSLGLTTIWFLTWVNTLGVFTSGKLQLITTILKILPLLIVSIGGLYFFDIQNFMPFNTSGMSNWAAITATTTLTFFAFLGIECATIPSGSVENPAKNVPKATLLGTYFATFIYLLSAVSIMGMIPANELEKSVTPFSDAAEKFLGYSGRYWIGAGAAVAAFGALNGFILIQGQLPYAVAKDGLFPSVFTKKNQQGVPVFGLLISSIFITLFMAMNYTKGLADQFKFLILLATSISLIPYLFTTAAYLVLTIQAAKKEKLVLLIPSLLFIAAFAFSLWVVIGTGEEAVYWGFVLLMMGVPFYVFMIWMNSSKKK